MEAAKQNQGGWGLFIYLFIVCYGGGGVVIFIIKLLLLFDWSLKSKRFRKTVK